MSLHTLTLTVALALTASFSSSAAFAQTLGDVARKEGERRQTVKPSGKIISNKDLPNVPPATAASPAPAAPGGTVAPVEGKTPAEKPAGDATAGSPKPAEKPEAGATKDQKYWADRMKTLREDLQRDRIFADSLQSRINVLTADFANRDDPAQRNQIGKDRQSAVDELARVKKSIVDRTKAIADLEEEARRANVPAGWLR